MNSFIGSLNHWGGQFLSFAWPMLWQSSLLIAIIFVLDWLLARKVRATIRYALWLVVLLKLLLPPTLALPTGAAWWLFQAKPAVAAPEIKNFTVTYGETSPQPDFVPTIVAAPPSSPGLNGAAGILLGSVTVSIGLLFWLAIRWKQVRGFAGNATVSDDFSAILGDTRRQAGLKSRVRLKIVEGQMSPAVCGLFRPVILLPRSLAEKLSLSQLRAVLLHEMFHLRRKDVWLNCAQTLLQIVYWWHPLLWLANARIRRVREEAVDDVVMLALRDEAEAYAPTLLEVAKLAFRRPLMSLGLVGIMESRSALRQRIERLVDFRVPRKAGLTFASLCGIFVFSAVALPMGEAPDVSDGNNLPATPASITTLTSTPTNVPAVLIQAAVYRLRQTDFEKLVSNPAFVGTRQDKVENFQQFNRLLKSSGFHPISRPRILTANGLPAQMYVGNETNSIELECRPVVTNGLVDLASRVKIISTMENVTTTNQMTNHAVLENGGGHVFSIKSPDNSSGSNIVVVTIGVKIGADIKPNDPPQFQQRLQAVIKRSGDGVRTNFVATGEGRKAIVSKLKKIRLENFSCAGLPLHEVLRQLSEESRVHDPEGKGLNFIIMNNDEDNAAVQGPAINPLTGLPVAAGPADIPVTVPAMQNVTLGDVLDAVVKGAARPVVCSIRDYGVRFTAGTNPPALFTRTFRVNPDTLYANLKRTGADLGNNTNSAAMIAAAVRKYAANLGVNWNIPKGKAIFFGDRTGLLLVRATEPDLDKIEKALATFAQVAPQIHVKARFMEVPRSAMSGFNASLKRTTAASDAQSNANTGAAHLCGILTEANFKMALRALTLKRGVQNLGEPEGVTTSGRQIQLRTTGFVTVVTNFAFEENLTNHATAIIPKISAVDAGPVFDVVPRALSDGYTVDMRMKAFDFEFLGYADVPTNAAIDTVTNSAGQTIDLPTVWPVGITRRASAHLVLYDGQTAVLSLGDPKQVLLSNPDARREKLIADWIRATRKKSGQDGKDILVFVTANLLDPAGNRIHSDDEMSFAQKGIPPQPPQSE